MDNQHKKITGYRDLGEGHILLMNKLKQIEDQFFDALKEVEDFQLEVIKEYDRKQPDQVIEGYTQRELRDGSFRNLAMARTHMEDACMRGVRAVALPLPITKR